MRKLIIVITCSFYFLSCSTQKNIAFKQRTNSVFATANELGANKASFIAKYGEPINKDIKKDGNDMVENLYYIEDVRGIMVTTKIKFVNDNLVEQSNYKMDTLDKNLKDLKEQMERNGLKIFNNGMKIDHNR